MKPGEVSRLEAFLYLIPCFLLAFSTALDIKNGGEPFVNSIMLVWLGWIASSLFRVATTKRDQP